MKTKRHACDRQRLKSRKRVWGSNIVVGNSLCTQEQCFAEFPNQRHGHVKCGTSKPWFISPPKSCNSLCFLPSWHLLGNTSEMTSTEIYVISTIGLTFLFQAQKNGKHQGNPSLNHFRNPRVNCSYPVGHTSFCRTSISLSLLSLELDPSATPSSSPSLMSLSVRYLENIYSK